MTGGVLAFQDGDGDVETFTRTANEICDGAYICEWIFNRTGSEGWAVVADWFVDRPLRILFILLVAWLVIRALRGIVRRFANEVAERSQRRRADAEQETLSIRRKVERVMEPDNDRARQRAVTLGAMLESLVSIVVWTVTLFIVLDEVGIALGPLIASAGIAGIAIGFGAQSIVKDFLAGIFVIIEDQYGVGDIIDVSYATGVVEEVGFRTTRIRDIEGVLWIVPNGEVQRVGNYSQIWARSVFDFNISYDADIDEASKVIKDVLDDIWRNGAPHATIIEEPEVLGVEELGGSSVVIRARVKTEPSEQFAVARVVRAAIKKAFDAAGIEIPYDHQVILLRNEAGEQVSPE